MQRIIINQLRTKQQFLTAGGLEGRLMGIGPSGARVEMQEEEGRDFTTRDGKRVHFKGAKKRLTISAESEVFIQGR